MQLKNLGIVLLIIGVAMMAYTGFNYVTTEKVVDIGPIQVNKQVNHPVQWSPIIGIVLAVGGVVLLVSSNKRS